MHFDATITRPSRMPAQASEVCRAEMETLLFRLDTTLSHDDIPRIVDTGWRAGRLQESAHLAAAGPR